MSTAASQVGEIFVKAGETFHKLANMTILLDPNFKEVKQSEPLNNGVTKIVMGEPIKVQKND